MSFFDFTKNLSNLQGANDMQITEDDKLHANEKNTSNSIYIPFAQMTNRQKREGFYTAAEVAKVLGVKRQTVEFWRKRKIFQEDILTHDGVYLYSKERVEQLQAVYHKGWHKMYRADDVNDLEIEKSNSHSICTPFAQMTNRQTRQKNFSLSELRDQLKQIPYSVLTSHGILQPARKIGFVCPACGNGSGEDGTGIQEHIESNGVRTSNCFKCNESFDNIKILALHYGLSEKNDFAEIIKRGSADLLNETIDENFHHSSKSTNSTAKTENYSRLKESQNNLQKLFLNRETWRGFPKEILEKLNWGFLEDFSHPKKTFEIFPAVIIPNVRGGILAREVTGNRKSNIAPTAPTVIHLPDGTDFILTIAEGAINAASLAYATDFKYPVIATGGTSGVEATFNFLKEKYSDEKPKINIQFDNDTNGAGQKAAEKMLSLLFDAGFLAVTSYLEEKDFDENSILQRDGKNSLSLTFERILTDANKKLDKLAEFKKNLSDWQKINGPVSEKKLAELKLIAEELSAFTVENMTEEVASDLVILNKVAQCKFYSFYSQIADNFVSILNSVAKNFSNFAMKNVLNKISEFVKKAKKDHKEFLKGLESESEKKSAEEKINQAKAKREQLFKRLQELKNAPLTDSIVAEIQKILRELCEWKYTKVSNSYHRECIKATSKNLTLIFENDPYLNGLVGYDEFLQCEVFLKQPIWKKNNCIKEEWQDSDDSELRFFLRDNYAELSNKDLIQDAFIHFSRQHQFNVMKDYFNNLPTWDKKTRVEKLFINWLKANDTPYTREATKIWLVAAMSRIYHPGCTFQAAIVLQGQQMIGKSHILERLGGNFYTVLSDNVDDSHALDALLNSWIVEIKEFSAARKADVNSLKSFLERSSDNRRLAYAKRSKLFKRHIVFAITLNDLQFLRDLTGNRRYWIIPCHGKKLQPTTEVDGEKLTDDYIKQVWAEVKVIYAEMFDDDKNFDDKKLQLSLENKVVAENIADDFIQDDGLRGQIEAGLEILIPPEYLWNVLTLEERREFFKHNFISIETNRLNERLITVKNDADRENLEIFLSSVQGTCTISGTVKRQHISAAEIRNEFFDKMDRRPSAQKINEILQLLDSWQLGDRIPYSAYGDLRKVYYRVKDEVTVESSTEEPFSVEAETEDLPF